MKAVNYQGAFKVKVEDVPRPSIEHPDDVIVKVTTAGTVAVSDAEASANNCSLSNLWLRPSHGTYPTRSVWRRLQLSSHIVRGQNWGPGWHHLWCVLEVPKS